MNPTGEAQNALLLLCLAPSCVCITPPEEWDGIWRDMSGVLSRRHGTTLPSRRYRFNYARRTYVTLSLTIFYGNPPNRIDRPDDDRLLDPDATDQCRHQANRGDFHRGIAMSDSGLQIRANW